MGLLGDLVVSIRGDTADFVQKVAHSQRQMSKFDRDMARIAKNMVKTGKMLTMAITVPIIGMAAAAVKTAGDFEKSMNRVRALTGATGSSFAELENTARELGATTQFSAKEAAEGMSYLAMAGFETNQIIGAMPATLNLAAAAQIDLGQAADIASNIMSGFNLNADELSGAVDIMAKTFTSSNTDLVQLGEAMSYVAPISEALGVSMEETSAAIGILSNAGIQASAAGTGLRKTLTTLVTQADRLGIVTQDSSGKMRPLADIIDDIGASGISTAEILEIFGQRAGPAVSVLLAQGGTALRDFTVELENAGGVAENIANVQMEGLFGAWKRFTSTAQESAISIGDVLLPKIIALLEGVRGLFVRFNELDDSTRKMILQYAAIAAAIGPLLIIGGKAILMFQSLKRTIALLNTTLLTNPIGQVAFAIGALVTALTIALPIIKRHIERQREYKALLYDTANQVGELSKAEQEAARKLAVLNRAEAQREQLEAIRKLGEAQRELNEIDEKALSSGGISAEAARRRGEILVDLPAMTRAVETHTAEVNDWNTAIGIIDVELAKHTDVIEHNTDVLEGNTDAIDKNADAWDAWFDTLHGEMLKFGGTIGEDFLHATKESSEDWTGYWAAAAAAAQEELLLGFFKPVAEVQAEWVSGWADAAQAAQEELLLGFFRPVHDDENELGHATEEASQDWSGYWEDAAQKAQDELLLGFFEPVEEAQEDMRTGWEKFADWYKDSYVNAIIDATQRMADAIVSIGQARRDAEISDLEAARDTALAAIDEQIEARRDAELDYEDLTARRLATDENYAAQIRAIQREQARRDKNLAIFNATIDTAQAIIGFLVDPGGPWGVVLSALAGATGIAQIAAIQAQPLPALAQGGIVTQPTTVLAGEGGQPELILPLDQLSDLLAHQGNFQDVGGGTTFVEVNLDSEPILRTVARASRDGRVLIDARAVV